MRQRSALLLTLTILAVPQMLQATDHQVAVGPGNAFSPATVTINVGDRVIWNRMGGTHNVVADDGSFGNAASSSWGSFPVPFNSAGTFEYFCEVHSSATGTGMNGTVIVTGGGGGNAGVLQFSTGNTSAAENGGNKTITVTRTGGDDGPVSVSYETVDGSATFPTDYIQTNNVLN